MQIDPDGEIENVYFYVSDALRYDAMPEELAARGSLMKTVSSSPLSCSTFSSIVTGLYPPQHGVWSFSDTIAKDIETVFDLFPGECPCYFGVSSVVESRDNAVHYAHKGEFESSLRSLESPFFVLDRELITHSPYSYDSSGQHIDDSTVEFTTNEGYWAARKNDPDQIRADYRKGARKSRERFESRMDILREKGVLENTLVIFTADHGELIGEYGLYGHAPVLVSESVYVPTLFYDGGVEVDVDGDFMGLIDLYPTICSLVGDAPANDGPGYDLTAGAPDRRLVFTARRHRHTSWGAWDRGGATRFPTTAWSAGPCRA